MDATIYQSDHTKAIETRLVRSIRPVQFWPPASLGKTEEAILAGVPSLGRLLLRDYSRELKNGY